jgi:hypothetical protein
MKINIDKETAKLERLIGIKCPFKVPDDYFNKFTPNLMKCIQDNECEVIAINQKRHLNTRSLLWIISNAVAIILCVFIFSNTNNKKETTAISNEKTVQNEEVAIDQAADYVMIDNDDVYNMVLSEK